MPMHVEMLTEPMTPADRATAKQEREAWAAMEARIAELEAELHAIKYEIMGGEDAPGSASAATVDDVKKEVARLRSIESAARGLADRIHRSE